ncbi:MAG: DUF6090 family protein [Bacteroidota bacterium]
MKKSIPYALREIRLVVIGILIAVKVNNMNSHQNRLEQAEDYLQKISHELKNDTSTLNKTILYIDQVIELKKLGLDKEKVDSLPVEYLDAALTT